MNTHQWQNIVCTPWIMRTMSVGGSPTTVLMLLNSACFSSLTKLNSAPSVNEPKIKLSHVVSSETYFHLQYSDQSTGISTGTLIMRRKRVMWEEQNEEGKGNKKWGQKEGSWRDETLTTEHLEKQRRVKGANARGRVFIWMSHRGRGWEAVIRQTNQFIQKTWDTSS